MNWPGALQRKATHRRLETHGKDVRGVTVYTHTFVLGGTGRADDRKHPFFTATADTAQAAEAAAREVYERAVTCTHDFARKTPTLVECSLCGVQKSTPMTNTAQEAASSPKSAKERKLLGFLKLSRPA